VTVTDVVMMGRTASVGWFRRAGADDRRAVARCLEQVGLSALARRPIGELSGGQQQRMFIARALAQQAEIFLVDEPLAGLDQPSQNELFQLLEGLARNGTAVVMTLHDLGLAAEHFDRIALLNRRVIALGRPADVFTPDLLLEAFGATGRAVRGGSGVIMIQDHGCCGGSAS
jgi:ABC-type Mn2+/Zn2+ transport system ATPase subunit